MCNGTLLRWQCQFMWFCDFNISHFRNLETNFISLHVWVALGWIPIVARVIYRDMRYRFVLRFSSNVKRGIFYFVWMKVRTRLIAFLKHYCSLPIWTFANVPLIKCDGCRQENMLYGLHCLYIMLRLNIAINTVVFVFCAHLYTNVQVFLDQWNQSLSPICLFEYTHGAHFANIV